MMFLSRTAPPVFYTQYQSHTTFQLYHRYPSRIVNIYYVCETSRSDSQIKYCVLIFEKSSEIKLNNSE